MPVFVKGNKPLIIEIFPYEAYSSCVIKYRLLHKPPFHTDGADSKEAEHSANLLLHNEWLDCDIHVYRRNDNLI